MITGAPGTGKTTLLQSLETLGDLVGEPARELIAEHRGATGEPSLDGSPAVFVERLVRRSIEKYETAIPGRLTLYDRGLPDCIAYAIVSGVDPNGALAAARTRRYAEPVFVAPPWQEIYKQDDMRRATFAMVLEFHDALLSAYAGLGYEMVELTKQGVAARAQLVTETVTAERYRTSGYGPDVGAGEGHRP